MAFMTELRQWCSIRIAVKDLNFSENQLLRAQKDYDAANKLLKQREIELESLDNRLQKYKSKQESRSARKPENYVRLVDDFEARHVAASDDVNRAFKKAQRQSRKLERERRKKDRRQALVEAKIRDFHPTSYVIVMDVADIISIVMMRDQMKVLYFTIDKSVTEGNSVSIKKAAKRIRLRGLTSNILVYLDGANFRILSVEESKRMGYRRLV